MRFRSVLAIVLRHYYLVRSSAGRMVPLFVWAGVDILLWGFISRYLSGVAGSLNFFSLLLGAVLLWNFLTRVMQGVTMAFFEDVWSRNFLNVFATPLTVAEYLSGLVLSSVVTSAFGLLVMIAMAAAIFDFSLLAYGAAALPFLFVLFLFGIALGIFGVAIVLRFGPAAEWMIWPIPTVLSPFVGVFYPLSTLPGWMHWIAYALPPSYVFENLRAIVAGGTASHLGLLAAIALAAGYIALACLTFAHVFRRAVRTGLIARYSAETVS